MHRERCNQAKTMPITNEQEAPFCIWNARNEATARRWAQTASVFTNILLLRSLRKRTFLAYCGSKAGSRSYLEPSVATTLHGELERPFRAICGSGPRPSNQFAHPSKHEVGSSSQFRAPQRSRAGSRCPLRMLRRDRAGSGVQFERPSHAEEPRSRNFLCRSFCQFC